MADQQPDQQPIDLSAGLVPSQNTPQPQAQAANQGDSNPIDLSAGLVPMGGQDTQPKSAVQRFSESSGIDGIVSAAEQRFKDVIAQKMAIHDEATKEFKAGNYMNAFKILAKHVAGDAMTYANPVAPVVEAGSAAADYGKSIYQPAKIAVQKMGQGDILGGARSVEEATENAMAPGHIGSDVRNADEQIQQGNTAGGLGNLAAAGVKTALNAAPAIHFEYDNATGELKEPGTLKQLMKGKEVAQPGAQSAVRTAAQQGAEAAGTADDSMTANIQKSPILKGNKTILDEHLDALASKEKAAYKAMDDAAEFDVKAERSQLARDKYKLKMLGNTDADVAQRGNLIESINDSQARIAEAESKMKEAGIDPKAADAMHRQRMAGTQFKKTLVKNTNPDGTVNIDGFLNDSKKLRFDKFGDRLEQFLGSDKAADDFMAQLDQMKKLGEHAVNVQKIAKSAAKSAAKWLGWGVLASGAATTAVKALWPQTPSAEQVEPLAE